jgi:hypothetical protein
VRRLLLFLLPLLLFVLFFLLLFLSILFFLLLLFRFFFFLGLFLLLLFLFLMYGSVDLRREPSVAWRRSRITVAIGQERRRELRREIAERRCNRARTEATPSTQNCFRVI